MNARATLLNDRTVIENDNGMVAIQATQDNFEVVLEI
jgi:hypothetical protein